MTIDGDTLTKAIRHGTRVLDLKTDGNLQKALIREVQWDHLGKDVLHVEFARVSMDERVVLPVPLHVSLGPRPECRPEVSSVGGSPGLASTAHGAPWFEGVVRSNTNSTTLGGAPTCTPLA